MCDGIVGGTCGCIQALPSEGSLCQRGDLLNLYYPFYVEVVRIVLDNQVFIKHYGLNILNIELLF